MPIFNRVRRKELSENHLMKYLKYAIGEIVLVVAGILIAIQLNEWKNSLADREQAQRMLLSLQAEYEANLLQLDTLMVYNQLSLDAYSEASDLVGLTVEVEDSVYARLVTHVNFGPTFDPANGALRSAISSSDIHLLDNEELTDLLFSWEDAIKDASEESSRLSEIAVSSREVRYKYIRVDVWKDIYIGMKPSKFESDFEGLFHDPQFEDYLNLRFLFATEYRKELDVIREKNVRILELIGQELEN